MNIKAAISCLVLMSTIMVGCETQQRYTEPEDVDLIQLSYNAAANLQRQLKKELPMGSMIVVSTFVNVDRLGETASFGRILASQVASAFNNAGYRIKAMEMPTEVFVREESGFLQLSDEARSILKANNATALVVGVFAPGRRTAYVSMRMVDVKTETIISTTDFSVPMGPDARVLLKPRATGRATN